MHGAVHRDMKLRSLHRVFCHCCVTLAQQLKIKYALCFHLGNGAREENIDWMADPSNKGMQQSYGMMVNYLYDLKKLDCHRKMLGEGKNTNVWRGCRSVPMIGAHPHSRRQTS